MKAKVEGHENLERDMKNGAIISKDADAYTSRILKKQQKEKDEQRIRNLEVQVEQINNSINRILSILESKNP